MYKHILLASLLLSASLSAEAEMCLGFDIGNETKEAVIRQLKNQEAKFQDLSDQGDGNIFFIKVTQLKNFEEWGTLKEAIFMFNNHNTLFALDLQYDDNGKSFNAFRNSLEMKYGEPKEKKTPYIQTYIYERPTDPSFGVELMHNESMDSQKMTSVMYLNKTLFSQTEQETKSRKK